MNDLRTEADVLCLQPPNFTRLRSEGQRAGMLKQPGRRQRKLLTKFS